MTPEGARRLLAYMRQQEREARLHRACALQPYSAALLHFDLQRLGPGSPHFVCGWPGHLALPPWFGRFEGDDSVVCEVMGQGRN